MGVEGVAGASSGLAAVAGLAVLAAEISAPVGAWHPVTIKSAAIAIEVFIP